MDAIVQGLVAKLSWPKPLRLRKLHEEDVAGVATLIVSILCAFEFSWLGTLEQRADAQQGKEASLRHTLALCASDPDRNAFWVLEDSTPGRQVS